jgi:hypothetical protein
MNQYIRYQFSNCLQGVSMQLTPGPLSSIALSGYQSRYHAELICVRFNEGTSSPVSLPDVRERSYIQGEPSQSKS